jgi:hypothetical protein
MADWKFMKFEHDPSIGPPRIEKRATFLATGQIFSPFPPAPQQFGICFEIRGNGSDLRQGKLPG